MENKMSSHDDSIPGTGMSHRYYGGLSGLALPVPKYLFPEVHKNSSRLTYYSSLFNSIEVNSTFYKLPQFKTITKWAEQVPPGFKFTFKLWQEISHVKQLDFREEDVWRFFQVINGAAGKEGCVLVQFPPSMSKSNLRQLQALLRCISANNEKKDWKIAVEFRHRSWYDSDVFDLLSELNTAMVIHDLPKSRAPMNSTADFIYLRFHGPEGNYRHGYADEVLYEYNTFIKEWLEEGKTVYVYFNNTMGDAYINLESLNRFVYL